MELIASVAGALLATATPSPQEVAAAHWWADSAWLGATAEHPLVGPGIEVVEQAWGTFRLNQSVWEAPLKLAGETYARGLGTHAASTVRVHLPGPARRFMALAGVDDNGNTRGAQPHVTFAVTADGRDLLRSDPVGVSDAPLDLDLDLDGARVLTLHVGEADDGFASDQADWCDARVELEDGRTVHLDDLPILRGPTAPTTALPFSFALDGRPSPELLPGWRRTVETVDDLNHRIRFRDPASGLRVTAHVRRFADFPAIDWVLEITNEGTEESPLLERIRPLDLSLVAPPGEFVRLHHPRGSTCEITDFLPQVDELKAEGKLHLAPVGGRSSNGALPFLHLDWGTGGMAAAIGWSGQWDLDLTRPDPRTIRLDMGQETCRLRLHPGETIRTPRVLLQWWNGTEEHRGPNLLRQLLMAQYCPRVNGELIPPPVTHPTSWSILASGVPGNESNQLEMLNAAADIGCEVYWLDAYWFPSGFPGGVGTWVHRPEDFPRGLRPLGDAAHARGMQFCLWFEPERVARPSQIAQEHPEFCIDLGQGDLLYDLGNPEALAFMTDLLSKAVSDYGVDIYREDFNIDPLPFWQKADAPDRQGITEIRFVEGLYAMWDGLLERHPGLVLDNCASGGRRIDLETVSRSYALWRSDFQDIGVLNQPNPLGTSAIASQVQNVGLGQYVAFSSNGLYSVDPYSVRSAMCGGINLYFDLRKDDYDRDEARAAIAEVKELRPYFLGDLYPLTPVGVSTSDWAGYQLHREDLDAGIALFFRRHQSPYLALAGALCALQPGAQYEWSVAPDYTKPDPQRGTGAELAGLRIDIAEAPGSVLVRYRKVGP